MTIATHAIELPVTQRAPDWVHLLPSGTFSGVDGRGPYTLQDPKAVIAASFPNGPIPLDINHSTALAAATGNPSPAVGWIGRMDVRSNGIWGNVAWTDAGRQALANREYRFISPVFEYSSTMAVLRIHSAALTNNPNLVSLTPLDHGVAGHARRPSAAMELTDADRMICRQMNIREQDFARTKQRIASEELAVARHGRTVVSPAGLNEADRMICRAMNIREEDFARTKQRSASEAQAISLHGATVVSPLGLTEADRKICLAMNLREEDFARQKAGAPDPYARFSDIEVRFLRMLNVQPDAFLARKASTGPDTDAWFEVLDDPAKNLYRSGLLRPSEDTAEARREFALSHLRRKLQGARPY